MRLMPPGDFEPWLRELKEMSLARRAGEIRRSQADGEIGLQMFLEATGYVPVPRMDVDIREIDLGSFPRGEVRSVRVHVRRFGRGILWGQGATSDPLTPSTRPHGMS